MPYTPPSSNAVSLVLLKPLPVSADLKLKGPPDPYAPPAYNAVALVLADALAVDANLLLGGEVDGPGPDAQATITGRVTLRAGVAVHQGFGAAITGRLQLRASVAVLYENAVFRGPCASVAHAHTPAQARNASALIEPWQTAQPLPAGQALMFDPAHAVPIDSVAAWSQAASQHAPRSPAWGTAQSLDRGDALDWSNATPHRLHNAPVWGVQAEAAGQCVDLSSDQAAATHREHTQAWGPALPRGRSGALAVDQAARAAHDTRRTPWQGGRGVHSFGGPWTPWVPPPVPPLPVRVNLRLCQRLPLLPCAALLVLGFDPCAGAPQSDLFILPARYYMAVHSITAERLPDGAALPIYNVSLGADAGSSVWTFSASGPDALWDALAPTGGLPQQVRITLDGLQWVFIVDGLQRQHEFGKRGVRISGRSATALIAAPYASDTYRNNDQTLTAQQLAQSALQDTGVGLDWGLDDWAVDTGAWSHGGTPLAAVQAIAEAAGGFINSHRSAPTLQVRHPYPTLAGGVPGGPWNWGSVGAPDVELAPDALITTSVERKDGQGVNAVYVAGTTHGVLARVLRAGTAGDRLAPLITHPLITHADAARQRALAVLGAAGAKHLVTVTLPVLTGAHQPGVLEVGQLVQINESTPWRAMVRSVSVEAAMPSLRQTIHLERHL